MDQGGTTRIVTADARKARVFTERVRGGVLKELEALRMHADAADLGGGRAQPGAVQQRHGEGRHGTGEDNLSAVAERRFLRRVAQRLVEGAAQGEFDRLVLMAPPHALGTLRAALPAAIAARIEAADPHERRQEGAEALRRYLRDARARVHA